MMKLVKNQQGISLIELLAVLALSSMVIILGASFQTGMFKAGNLTITKNELRNESVLILDALNKAMENADDFASDNQIGAELKAVNLLEIEKIYDENKKEFTESRNTFSIEVRGNALFIRGKQVSDERHVLRDTKFLINGNQLVCTIILNTKDSNGEPYKIIKIFDLS
ncbi:hypothetical protein HMPREF3291_23035 [Bacillus sp. HMSC76G11]|nr:hypothetical protein HMPREF3291_23035 [Bacillus sp. HMSC76G11]